ncbi:MAG: hypothetical protein ACK4L7_08125 [Flavobacteriales bacterium]
MACALLSGGIAAQTFDLEQLEQVFRPRLRLDARYQAEAAFMDTTGRLGLVEGVAAATFPVRSRFGVGLRPDTAAQGLKELLANSIRVEASQLLVSARFGTRSMRLGFEGPGGRRLHTASAGLLGVRLTRRCRVLFWSANANASEEERTLGAAVPRFNSMVGKLRVRGLRRQFFYGMALSLTDGLVLPMPFLGGTAPLGGNWSFNYVLPAQVYVGYRPKAGTRLNLGLTADGFRSGMEWHGARVNVNHGQLRVFAHARHRINKTLQVRVEAGWALAQTVRLTGADRGPARFPAADAFGIGAGVNILFGRGVLERLLDEVLR